MCNKQSEEEEKNNKWRQKPRINYNDVCNYRPVSFGFRKKRNYRHQKLTTKKKTNEEPKLNVSNGLVN